MASETANSGSERPDSAVQLPAPFSNEDFDTNVFVDNLREQVAILIQELALSNARLARAKQRYDAKEEEVAGLRAALTEKRGE